MIATSKDDIRTGAADSRLKREVRCEMAQLNEITPLVLTYNEAPNIGRALGRLKWAREIVLVDSFSTDETLEIARSFPQVRALQRKFDNHTTQWNYGIDQCQSRWVLSLDADYILSDVLIHELEALKLADDTAACYARFRYCIGGRPLRGTLYPPRAVLFRKDKCRYEPDGHTQRLCITGATGWLRHSIDHDDRKPFARWLQAQDRYTELEAAKLLSTPVGQLRFPDRLRRKIIFAPALVFLYTMFGKGLILDGWPGWYYVFQRTLAETLLSLRLLENKLKS